MRADIGRPTDERLRHARGDFDVAQTRGGRGTTTMRDCPLERARSRSQLDEREYQAGVKFRHHWFHAGMAGQIGSPDLDRIFARDLSMLGFMPKTEQQVFHRQKYREALAEMGERSAIAVECAVCNEVEFEQIGRKFGYANDPQARAAGMTLVRNGLYQLAKLWGI